MIFRSSFAISNCLQNTGYSCNFNNLPLTQMLLTCAVLLLSAHGFDARPQNNKQPSGGPLGFFGQGGLFDFSSGQSGLSGQGGGGVDQLYPQTGNSPYIGASANAAAAEQRAYALAAATARDRQQSLDDSRTFVHIKQTKRRRRRRRRRPCRRRDARTWPTVNFVYLEVNEHYNCAPAYGDHQSGGGGSFSGGSNHVDEEEEYDDIIDEYNDPVTVTNSHGSLVSSPAVSANNRPSGGPLGFFGQGGLFDIAGGQGGQGGGGGGGLPGGGLAGGSGSQNQLFGVNQLHDAGYDDVRPVIEINLPESLQDAV